MCVESNLVPNRHFLLSAPLAASPSSKKAKKSKAAPKLSFDGIESEASDGEDVVMEELPSMAPEEPTAVAEEVPAVAKRSSPYEATVAVRSSTGSKVRKLQITRTMKEQMLKMSRFERKRFLRDFKVKRRPYGELAKRCTVLWEIVRGTKADKLKKVRRPSTNERASRRAPSRRSWSSSRASATSSSTRTTRCAS